MDTDLAGCEDGARDPQDPLIAAAIRPSFPARRFVMTAHLSGSRTTAAPRRPEALASAARILSRTGEVSDQPV